MSEIIKWLILLVPGPLVFILFLVLIPEKIEKWSALLWKFLGKLGNIFSFAHKRYVRHDLQGRVNDFCRRLRRLAPYISDEKLQIEWVEPSATRESIIADGMIVLRLRKDDPQDHNFVHGAFIFVSGMLLRKVKRYISMSQKQAIDLVVCSKLIQEEKPGCVEFFFRCILASDY